MLPSGLPITIPAFGQDLVYRDTDEKRTIGHASKNDLRDFEPRFSEAY